VLTGALLAEPGEGRARTRALGSRVDGEHPELALVVAADLAPRGAGRAVGDDADDPVVERGHPDLGLCVAGRDVVEPLTVVVLGAGQERVVRRHAHVAGGGVLVGPDPAHLHDRGPQMPNVVRG
jgi:hypothetical protein